MAKERTDQDFLSTTNIYVAAFALAAGCKVVDVKKINERKSSINLRGPDAKNMTARFYAGEKLSVVEVMDAYRTLKDRIFEK